MAPIINCPVAAPDRLRVTVTENQRKQLAELTNDFQALRGRVQGNNPAQVLALILFFNAHSLLQTPNLKPLCFLDFLPPPSTEQSQQRLELHSAGTTT
jgi:hypothetical protein